MKPLMREMMGIFTSAPIKGDPLLKDTNKISTRVAKSWRAPSP